MFQKLFKKKKQAEHICKFVKVSKTADLLFPETLKFYKARRKFREFFLVSEENGKKQCITQSSAGFLYEKEKHLSQHFYMIHPNSKFRQYWELIIILEIILCLTFRTFTVSYFRRKVLTSFRYQLCALLTDLFEMADIGLRFLTGYHDTLTQEVALEPRKIFFYNLKQFLFYIDLVSSFPVEFIVFIFAVAQNYHYSILILPIYLKVLKFTLFTQYLLNIAAIYRWSELVVRIVWSAIVMFLFAHWLSCLTYLFLYGDEFGHSYNKFHIDDYIIYRHFTLLYTILSIFFFENGVLEQIQIVTTIDYSYINLVLLFIHLSNVVFLGLFVELLGLKTSSVTDYEEMIQEVQQFLVQENLPKHIHEKVMNYFEFRFRHRYYREKIILETLSPPLRREIADFLFLKTLTAPGTIFENVSEEVASLLCLKLKYEAFLPGDVIFRFGKKSRKLYITYSGTIALYSVNREVEHLNTGQMFGRVSFSSAKVCHFTAVALEMSECYSLRFRDFLSATVDHIHDRNKVVTAANTVQQELVKSVFKNNRATHF